MVVDTFDMMQGGELLVPADPVDEGHRPRAGDRPGRRDARHRSRPGEKLHEEMISPEEGRRRHVI